MNALQLISPHGEVVPILTAEDLLKVNGVDLDGPLSDLAAWTVEAEHARRIIDEARSLVGERIIDHLDRRASWTVREGDLEVKAASPNAGTTAYDPQALYDTLRWLTDEDEITYEAWSAAVDWENPEPYLKVRQAGVNALLKRGGKIAEAINRCRVETAPPKRTAKVKRVGS